MPYAPERFWNRVEKSDGCWLWRGDGNGTGYGVVSIIVNKHRTRLLAHRYSFQYHFGPIHRQTVVMHLCDVPLCVNPSHLAAGTQRDNILDMMRKKRHWSFRLTACAQGHPRVPENFLKGNTPGTWRCRECHRIDGARRYARKKESA